MGNRPNQSALPAATGGHKKNQYSTGVKSNYKNLVGDNNQGMGFNGLDEFGNQQFQRDTQNLNPMIDIEIFNSSQNKTTE